MQCRPARQTGQAALPGSDGDAPRLDLTCNFTALGDVFNSLGVLCDACVSGAPRGRVCGVCGAWRRRGAGQEMLVTCVCFFHSPSLSSPRLGLWTQVRLRGLTSRATAGQVLLCNLSPRLVSSLPGRRYAAHFPWVTLAAVVVVPCCACLAGRKRSLARPRAVVPWAGCSPTRRFRLGNGAGRSE